MLPSGVEGVSDKVQSMLRMHGFSNIQTSNPSFDAGATAVIATKPAFKAGGTSLKGRKKKTEAQAKAQEEANPWAALGSGDAEGTLINEDSLMRDEAAVKAMTD